MNQPLDFQSIIITLQNFWNDQGCLIWQPYHTEVGAGTMNPGTVLRVLGPEPWNVAYVEPSIRPDDGRYGENPNRFYQHIQYQVILKPDPGNPQELYLQSLVALGIDPHKHDIRFVEDNWAQPAISAWGLGWEVWLDGLEITQFTYFQQVCGQTLDPVAVELTYGLERIAMAIQGVRDFRDIRWNQSMTYGDVYLANEQESSKYAFELAGVERLRQMFDLYEAEAKVCLENQQVLPAHDYLLKCSHTFNILDTRGAIGVTERAGFFRRMRALVRGIGDAYIEQRTRLEFPWLEEQTADSGQPTAVSSKPAATLKSSTPLLVEIGTEELPPGDLEDALKQLKERVPALLNELRLEHGEIKILGTPRRLVIHVEDLAPNQEDIEELVKGPPANRAFDADGIPTKAAEGFARSKGIDVGKLEAREIEGGEYVVAVVKQDGRSSIDVLAEVLPKLVSKIHFVKTMRWNETNIAFSRPIRWLLALHGENVIPFEYASLQAEANTHGLRFSKNEIIPIKDPKKYFSEIAAAGILLDPEERMASIEVQIQALAKKVGGEIPHDPDMLLEVTHLVEAPNALLGEFNPRHLELPDEVLISVMKKHQRYFPIEKVRSAKSDVCPGTSHPAPRTLLPHFITVANKSSDGETTFDAIIRGNEDVIRARFADAAYFVREDMESKLEDFIPQLEKLTFQTKLGSMLDKTKRIEALVDVLAPMLGLATEEITTTRRAAQLCKADLATQMVVEMTSLQGVMGRDYALHSGEPEEVAKAIFEHYMPRSASDTNPANKPGLAVGLADRLDSLSGLFAAGLAPSGNKDPFALRRAALGLVGNLIAWELNFDIRQGLEAAAKNLPIEASAESQNECLDFIIGRLRQLFLDQDYAYDVVDAVVNAQGHNPAKAAQAVKELSQWVVRDDWETILPAYSRCVRITRSAVSGQLSAVSTSLFENSSEQGLFDALQTAESAKRSPGSVKDFLTAFEPMIPAIDRFFEDVLVMVEDEEVRDNRLALLQRIASLADGVADMSKLESF